MERTDIIILGIGFTVLLADILIRLVVFPRRKDQTLEQMCALLSPESQASVSPGPIEDLDPLAESLLRHFEQSYASRHLIKTLSKSPAGMCEKELELVLNREVAGAGKRELPTSAIRKVILILMGADFIRLQNGKLSITEMGWTLHSLLRSRGRAGE